MSSYDWGTTYVYPERPSTVTSHPFWVGMSPKQREELELIIHQKRKHLSTAFADTTPLKSIHDIDAILFDMYEEFEFSAEERERVESEFLPRFQTLIQEWAEINANDVSKEVIESLFFLVGWKHSSEEEEEEEE